MTANFYLKCLYILGKQGYFKTQLMWMNAKFYPGSYFGKQCKTVLDCRTIAGSTKKSADRDSKVMGTWLV